MFETIVHFYASILCTYCRVLAYAIVVLCWYEAKETYRLYLEVRTSCSIRNILLLSMHHYMYTLRSFIEWAGASFAIRKQALNSLKYFANSWKVLFANMHKPIFALSICLYTSSHSKITINVRKVLLPPLSWR